MRDIREDLRERLAAIVGDKMALQARMGELDEEENTLKLLLRRETDRWSRMNPPLFEDRPTRNPLSQIIVSAIEERGGAITLDDLKSAAERAGYDFGEKTPGRAIHFALVGMQQHGIVERLEDGSWRRKEVQ